MVFIPVIEQLLWSWDVKTLLWLRHFLSLTFYFRLEHKKGQGYKTVPANNLLKGSLAEAIWSNNYSPVCDICDFDDIQDEKHVFRCSIVSKGFDLQPGSSAARPAQLFNCTKISMSLEIE
eukprot:15048-Pelagomonas_calceolata.AAC.2